jgi:hypothetical protein
MPEQSGTATLTLSVSDGEDTGTLLVEFQRPMHGFPPRDEIRPFRM